MELFFLFFNWIFRGLDLLCHMVFTGETTSGAGYWEGILFSFKFILIIPPIIFLMLLLSFSPAMFLDEKSAKCNQSRRGCQIYRTHVSATILPHIDGGYIKSHQ